MQRRFIEPVYTQPDALRRKPNLNQGTMLHFINSQLINGERNLLQLRPFTHEEFGNTASSPSPAHIEAVNDLLARLRQQLMRHVQGLEVAAYGTGLNPILNSKTQIGRMTKSVEQVWDYYLELFSQRQTRFAPWLLATDRIARDCYQVIYSHLATAKSIPSPPPFSYMETTRTPSTFRRGIKFSRIGRNLNPFPIVQLPFHRLINPWTLGAVHHEVAHNLQSDLGLWQIVPRRIYQRLSRDGVPSRIAQIWARWHKEIWADLVGLLLGGPPIVASLIDVLARSPRHTFHFNERAVHPIAYFRLLINTRLLARIGFSQKAAQYQALWHQLYPHPENSRIPDALLRTLKRVSSLVVDEICYQPYQQIGGQSLVDIAPFTPIHHKQAIEAASRLARGIDPGIIPERFLVAAARHALERGFASPEVISRNFYKALTHR